MTRSLIPTYGQYATVIAPLVACGLFCFAFFIGSVPTSAQTALLGTQSSIEIEPRYPKPGETFTARLHIYSDTVTSVSWAVDGSTLAEERSEVTLIAPATLGDSMQITAQAQTNAAPLTLQQTVTPSEVDIIIEADSIAPYFYAGRRVPSAGVPANISVVPHIFETNGTRIDVDSLIYIWSVNNVTIAEGRGLNRFTLAPQTLNDPAVRLRIESTTGRVHYETTFRIPRAEPGLVFYPVSPLTGLSHNAIQDAYFEANGEATVRAEPYFIQRDVFANAQYAWSVGGTTVDNQSSDPQLITLRGERGASDVGFSIRNLSALSQYAAGLFRINFN